MTVLETTETAVGIQYRVRVDGQDLGLFDTCEGLSVEVVIETREEGGNNEFVHQLPTGLRYPHLTLTRALGKDTSKVTEWIATMATGYRRRTCQITVLTSDGREVASWSLQGVVPVRWSGPQLQPDNTRVLTEQLVLAHHGFAGKAGA